MQAALRAWVLQAASGSGRGLRGTPPVVLLSLLCAAAFSPLFTAVVGVGAAAVVAGSGVLSSISGGVLSGIIVEALDRARSKGKTRTPTSAALVGEIAEEIGRMLAAGDTNAQALRAEIATVLQEIDAGGTVLRAAMEESNDRVRRDVIAAIGVLGSDFAEMAFLIKDVAQAAAEIQERLDVQGAGVRAIIDQNNRQSTDIRLVREDVAAFARLAGASAYTGDGADDNRPRWVHGCPYRGLLPFEETHAEIFYGRERLTAELAVKVAARAVSGGLVVVTGASGAGKSSLLRAGLLPKLALGKDVAGSQHWPRIAMTPTKDPLSELAARLSALGGSDAVAVRQGLDQHPGQAHLAVRAAVLADASHQQGQSAPGDSNSRLVLIVDQFEQVFTLNPGDQGEASQQAFITALWSAATNPIGPKQESPALVVIAVRGDFWDQCATHPKLREALQEGQFVVGPMTESDMRLAITGPAEAAGLRIDPALTDTILGDLRAMSGENSVGVLPLLSQAMALTWEKREGDHLTSHGYGQVGGVSHAVQTGADKAYEMLSPSQQMLARELLRSMTVASRDGKLTRRPVTRADLYEGHPDNGRAQVDAVLEAFAAERLIVLNEDVAQISHDVLLSAWPRLRGWLEDDQATWILHGQLADAASVWRERHRDASFLYRGTQLTALEEAAARWSGNPARYPALSGTQQDFLHASERAADRSARLRRGAFAILAVLAVAASIASVFAFQQRSSALQQRNQAIYNEVIAEAVQAGSTNTSLAAQLNFTAYRMRPTQDLTTRLLGTENTPLSTPLTSGAAAIFTVAFSADSGKLICGDLTGAVQLWNVANPSSPHRLSRVLTGGTGTVTLSPNGRILANGNENGTVWLWDVADPAGPRLVGRVQSRPRSVVGSVAFSPDGRILASGSGDGQVRLWDVAAPTHPQLIGQPLRSTTSNIGLVAFSPDARLLASGNDHGTIRLWDVADPAHPRELGPIQAGGQVTSMSFSPDGRTLATAADQSTVRLWDIANPAHPLPVGHPLQPLTGTSGNHAVSVAFSPDGRILASGNDDGTVLLWDVAAPARAEPLGQPLTGSPGTVISLAFSPDGRTLASGSENGTARLWNIPRTLLTGATRSINSVAFSPDGRTLASGSGDGTVRLWDVANPANPHLLDRPLTNTPGVDELAYSPDGRTLAVSVADGTIRLWDVADPGHPWRIGPPLHGSPGTVGLVFSPNSRTLVSGSQDDGTVRLWDVADPVHPRQLGRPLRSSPTGGVLSVAFSPDGRILAASGGGARNVQLWDVADPAHPQRFGQAIPGSQGGVVSVAFSPRGRTLAASGADGTVWLWNVADAAHPRRTGQPLPISLTGVFTVAFGPDGRTIATGSGDGTVRLWNVADPARPKPMGQPLPGSPGVVAVAFSPHGGILASGSTDDTTRIWHLNVGYAIDRICATTKGNLTLKQWDVDVHQLPYQPPCGQ